MLGTLHLLDACTASTPIADAWDLCLYYLGLQDVPVNL